MILGIDTSNYTTSLALVSENGEILVDERKSLRVKAGERGLRQSEALFQHMGNLPDLSSTLLKIYRRQIKAVAVSSKPRPAPESYMPVFLAGYRCGQVISQALDVPMYCFSHQEGHIRACLFKTDMDYTDRFLAWHLSGGTSELLLVEDGGVTIVGGSKDISFGQLIDRVGVALGFDFPCGAELDALAVEYSQESKNSRGFGSARGGEPDALAVDYSQESKSSQGVDFPCGAGMDALATEYSQESKSSQGVDFPCGAEPDALAVSQRERKPLGKIPIDGLYCNLSGLETQARRAVAEITAANSSPKELVCGLFSPVADCLKEISGKAAEIYGVKTLALCGGVSASEFLRKNISLDNIDYMFCAKALATDNAVGVALLGADKL